MPAVFQHIPIAPYCFIIPDHKITLDTTAQDLR